jgi:hypothetical protein
VSGRQPGSSYWLLGRSENGGLEVLATDLAGGEEALLVFSHEEEAEMFLRLGQAGLDGWQARESTAGELISVLYGLCAGVERVALDPLPEMLVERTIGLVSLSRERFVDLVLGRERPLARRELLLKFRNAFCSTPNSVIAIFGLFASATMSAGYTAHTCSTKARGRYSARQSAGWRRRDS